MLSNDLWMTEVSVNLCHQPITYHWKYVYSMFTLWIKVVRFFVFSAFKEKNIHQPYFQNLFVLSPQGFWKAYSFYINGIFKKIWSFCKSPSPHRMAWKYNFYIKKVHRSSWPYVYLCTIWSTAPTVQTALAFKSKCLRQRYGYFHRIFRSAVVVTATPPTVLCDFCLNI